MKIYLKLLLVLSLLWMTGCASTQKPIGLTNETFSTTSKTGVYVPPKPAASGVYPGANCLLCSLAANSTHKNLLLHLSDKGNDIYASILPKTEESLNQLGVETVLINDTIDFNALPKNPNSGENKTKQDFSSLSEKYDIDRLVVVEFSQLGIKRPYLPLLEYIPADLPSGHASGFSYMIDLKDNAFLWYHPFNATSSLEPETEWNQKPDYPNMTAVFTKTLEQAKQRAIAPLNALHQTEIADASDIDDALETEENNSIE